MHLHGGFACFALLLGLAASPGTPAAPGEFDRSFGQNGLFRLSDPALSGPASTAIHAATDRFGNVFASGGANGREVVVRLFPDGGPDESLGPQGALVSAPQTLISHRGLASFPVEGGKAVLVRSEKFACFGPGAGFCAVTPAGVHVRRLEPDGAVDPSYTPPAQLSAGAYAGDFQVVDEPDGGLLFAGYQGILLSENRIGRLDRRGVPDTAFEAAAKASLACRDISPDRATGIRFLRQADGRILVAQAFQAGSPAEPDDGHRLCVTRLEPDGNRDLAWGTQGELVLESLLFTSARDRIVALLPLAEGGAALLVEQHTPATTYAFHYVIAWLTPQGALDASRPGGGITGPTDLHVARVAAAAMQPDGKIVLAGYPGLPSSQSSLGYDLSQPRIGRLTPQGGADLGFGPDGSGFTALLTFGSRLLPSHVHIAPGGDFFVAGAAGEAGPVNANESTQFAVAKLRGDASPPESRSGGGGCGIVAGAPFDPTLPGLAALALGWLLLRRRGGRAGAFPTAS